MRVLSGLLGLAVMCVGAGADAAPSCVKQVAKLTRTLNAVPNYVQLVPPQLPVNLPRARSSGLVKRLGLVVDVKGGRYSFQNKQSGVSELAPLEAALEGINQAEALTGVPQAPAYLRLDAEQAVQDVLPLMCKLAAQRQLWILLSDPGYPPAKVHKLAEPPTQIKDVLTQVAGLKSAVEKAAAFGELLQQATGSCDALTQEFVGLSQVAVSQRSQSMRQRAAAGLTACKCQGADVPAIEHLLARILAPTQPPAYARRVKLRCAGKGRPIRLPKGAQVQALAKALQTGSGPVRIEVAP